MELRDRPSSHLLGGTLGVFLAEALIVPTGLLTAVFLTRRLGPEGYGLFTLAATVVAWIEWSVASVFSRTAVKALGEADDWRPVGATLLRLLLGAGLGAAALLGLLAGPIATLLDEPTLAPYLYVFALGVPLFGLSYAHRLVLIGTGRFYGRALAGASRWTARLLLIVLLVELGLSVQGAVLGTIGATFVELAVSRFYARPSLSGRPAFPARQLLNAAVPLVLLALSVRPPARC
jgi:O-antigen/teichoic acid export membrane protein